MNLIRLLIKKHKEIMAYLIVGILTTVVSLGTYYICVITFLDPKVSYELQLANIISWITAVTFAYVTNRIFVFESKNKNIMLEIVAFSGSRLLSLFMEMLIMFVSVTLIGINDKIAKLIVQIVVTIANYVLSKFLVFRKK